MKKNQILTALLCTLCTIAFGQTRQVTGRVISDSTQAPLAGVTVSVKGSNTRSATGANGRYAITIPDRSNIILVFSSVGYTAQEVSVGGRSSIDVVLATASADMDVVVIGYQSVRRKDLLASVSSIGARDLKDVPIASAAEALNGRLAGVTASTAEGSPDADVRIRVRGGMSITQDNSPLFIVDGVQVENALSTISPQDIQSIDVLKDAAATSIYGARGANGVIVITTKSGRTGRTVVTYDGYVGVRNLARKLDVLSPYEFVIYQSERSRGSVTDSTNFANSFGTTWDTLANYRNVPAVDWQDEVFGNTGISTRHILGASGGSGKITYNFTYTYNNDKAVVLNSNYQRHLINAKTDYKITKKMKLGLGFRYTNQDVLGAGVSSDRGSAYNRLRNAVRYRPFLSKDQDIDDADPLADPNVGNGLNLVNPIQLADAEYRKRSMDAKNFTASFSYNILKRLTFRSTFGYDKNNVITRQFFDSIAPLSVIQGGRKPIAALDTNDRTIINNSNVLTYSVKGWKKKHDFDILVGEETYDARSENFNHQYRDYPLNISSDDAFKQTNLGVSFVGYPRVNKSRYTNLSFFSRVNYAFDDKYLFSFNVRRDGASKFAPGLQWGTFPGGSVAWRVKREGFMQNVNFINDMKVRFAYGKIGNNRINDYLFLTTFGVDGRYYYGINNQSVIAYYPTSLVNERLQWESLVNRNLGVDLTLFNNRVDLSVDLYNNNSEDLLLNVPIAPTYGYTQQLQNIGRTNNKGIEMQLNAGIVRKQAFSWNANFNISHNRNQILELGPNQQSFFPAASWGVSGQPTDYIVKIGMPVGAMWGLVTDGFYRVEDFDYNASTRAYTLKAGVVNNSGIIGVVQPGSIKFKDLNGDGKIDLDNDRTMIGDPTPKFTGGLQQQFTYKNWDASVFVNFSVGADIYNANKIELTNGYTINANMLKMVEDRWRVITPDGQTAQWVSGSTAYGIAPDQLAALNAGATMWQPLRGAGAFYPHSWAIEDGSFLRFNNFTLGYTIPSRTLRKMHMNRLRLYFTANNLAILTSYTGYDPEVSVRNSPLTPNLDYSAYPKSRAFIFGVTAGF